MNVVRRANPPAAGQPRSRSVRSYRPGPTTISWLVFALGVVNLASALSPALRSRLHLLVEIVPEPAPAIATAVTASIGVVLLVLAPSLRRRKRRAWAVALALSAVAVVGNLLKGLDFEEATLAAVVLVALVATRRQFTAPPDPRKTRLAVVVLLVGTCVAVAVGWGLLTLHHDSQARDTTAVQRLEQSALGLVGVRGPVHFRYRDAKQDSDSALVVLGLCVAVAAMGVAFSSYAGPRLRSRSDERRLRELVSQYGGEDSLSYFGLRDDRVVTFTPAAPAAVTFRTVGSVAIAAGDPVGHRGHWDQAIDTWLAHVRAHGWTPAVVGASRDGASAYRRCGLATLELGDEAILDVASFNLEGRHMRTVRQAVSRVTRAGYVISCDRAADLSPVDIAEATAAAAAWRGEAVERGYSMALGRLVAKGDEECILVRARDGDGALRGLTYWVPWGRTGLSLDLMRRAPDSVNGTIETMIVALIGQAGQRDITQVSLNFVLMRAMLDDAPPEGATPTWRAGHRALHAMSKHWQIESLYRSCAKYHPTWVTRYLCYPTALDLPRVIVAILRAEQFLTPPKLAWRSGRARGSRRGRGGAPPRSSQPSEPPQKLT